MSTFSPEDEARLRRAIQQRSEIRALQELNWVRDLVRLATAIRQKQSLSSADELAMFWIRLGGLLHELFPSYERFCQLADDVGITPSANALITGARQVRDACALVKGLLSDDEILWAEYRRDTEGHVWQESYELGVKSVAKGTLKETRRIALIDRTLTMVEIDQRLRAVVRAHNRNEAAIAIDYATRLAPAIEAILSALEPLNEPG